MTGEDDLRRSLRKALWVNRLNVVWCSGWLGWCIWQIARAIGPDSSGWWLLLYVPLSAGFAALIGVTAGLWINTQKSLDELQ